MPLIKSKSDKAFKKNVKVEIEAGKPQKQSLAIAFDIQRRAKKAKGGDIGEKQAAYHHEADEEKSHRDPELGDVVPRKKMAEGGNTYSATEQDPRSKKANDSIRKSMGLAPIEDKLPSTRAPAREETPEEKQDRLTDEYNANRISKAHGGSIVDDIMSKRKKMAEGGEIDLEENSEESSANPNGFDERNMDADDAEELLADTDLMDSDMDLEPEQTEEDAADLDMISAIRRKMNARK